MVKNPRMRTTNQEFLSWSPQLQTFSRLSLFIFCFLIHVTRPEIIPVPRFKGPVANVTVPKGREATLTCTVDNLGSYKVAFVRIDTQTILTIHTHVITRNHRISLSHTDSWTWNLQIKNVRESDRGWYMCQLNTDPMMSQTGFLQVVVSPDILDYPTSSDMVVREGTNVTLQCEATGFPPPRITWRREDKQKISFEDNLVDVKEGAVFNLSKVNRLHMGTYLCIASNSVLPSVSRRISLIVHFPPMIMIPEQLVGAGLGQSVVLECHSEAFPKSINYWRRDNGDTIVHGSKLTAIEGEKYEPVLLDNVYKVTMRLTIRGVSPDDYGTYVCLSKNSLGETDGHIKLYPITLTPSTHTAKTTAMPFPAANTSYSVLDKGGNRRLQIGGASNTYPKSKGNANNKYNPKRDFSENQSLNKAQNSDGEVVSQDLEEGSSRGVSFPSDWTLLVSLLLFNILLGRP